MTFDLGLFKRQRYTPPSINSFGGNYAGATVLSSSVTSAVHVFISSGVFTLPAYVSTVTAQIFLVGGGGGGGGNNGGAGGGGGGVSNSSTFTLSPGVSYAISVAAGGTVGVGGSVAGGSGTASKISNPSEVTYSVALSNSAYLTAPANTAYDITGGNFTVEFWVYLIAYNTAGGSGSQIVSTFLTGPGGWLIGFNGIGTLSDASMTIWTGGTGSTLTAAGINSTTLRLNTWHHIAWVRSGVNSYMFMDGVSYPLTGTYVAGAAGQQLAIGVYHQNLQYAGNPNWNISNLRIVKGLALYTSNFTPPITALTNVTADPLYAVVFNGTSNWLSTPQSANFTFAADFTVEFWVYATVTQHGDMIGTANNAAYLGAGNSGWVIARDASNQIKFAYQTSNIWSVDGPLGMTVQLSTWSHVAVVRLGSTITGYVNGRAGTSPLTSSAIFTSNLYGVYVGAGAGNQNLKLGGNISNLRIVNGVAVYTGNFTPPTTNLSTTQSSGTNIVAISTASYVTLLTAQSNTIVDNSTYAQTLTPTGTPTVISTATLYSTSLLTLKSSTFIDNSPNTATITVVGANATITSSTTLTPPFGLAVAFGGGGGGSGDGASPNYIGVAGGSGGGGATTGGTNGAGGAGTAGQGFAGGAGKTDGSTYRSGGGGGGAGAVGTTATSSVVAGSGGTGTFTTIISTTTAFSIRVGQYVTATNAIYFGGGGAGGPFSGSSSIAGLGGGGLQKTSGTSNTGGGGGGAGSAGTPGAGGSGIVIITYPVPNGISTDDTTPTDPYFKNTSLLLTGAVLNKSIPTQWPVDYLVVGGGGGGGTGPSINNYSGGGGGGGLVTTSTRIAADNDTYTIQVGAGGLAGALNSNGTNGSNSFITSSTAVIVALGGGYGATRYIDGGSGGSGGGAGIYISYSGGAQQLGGVATQPASASGGFGFGGGTGFNYNWGHSGGGGGAGAAGGAATGGIGKYLENFSSFGESGYFASGGAGVYGACNGGCSGASQLGGGGGFPSNSRWQGSATVPRSAITGTGGGGAIGMPGADGTVIFRHPIEYGTATVTGNPITTSTGGYTYYKWSTSGTIRFTPQQLILSNNNVFVDSSANALTITPTGTPTQGTFSPFGQNWSNYFGANTDYLSLPVNATNSGFSTGNFTVEAWIYPTVAQATTIVSSNYSYGTAAGNWAFYTTVGSANLLYFNGGAASASGANHASSVTTTIPINQWTHVAYSKISSVGYFFVNGLQIGAGVADTTGYSGAAGTLYIGRQADGTGFLTGYISNLRIVKGTALYTSNFTPATAPLTVVTTTTALLTAASNNYIDKSGVNTITTVGSPRVIRFSPFTQDYAYNSIIHSGSTYFNGSSQYLQAQSTTAGDFGTGNFTVEFWMYATAAGTFVAVVGTQSIAGSGTAGMWRISNRLNSANGIYFNYTTGSTFVDLTFSTTNYNDGAWHHVAACRALGTLRMFVDGASLGTPTAVSQSLTSGQRINIGYQPQDGAYYTGYVSNLRVVKGVAAYTTNFTPLSTPVMSVQTYLIESTQTSLLLNGSNIGIIDSTMQNNVISVGTAGLSPAVVKYNTRSMYFNGTSDTLKSPYNPAFNFGTGDFTVECWVYITAATANTTLIDTTGNGGSVGWFLEYSATRGLLFALQGATISYATTPVLTTWTHLAVTRASSIVRCFINGTSVVSGTYTNNILSTVNLTIGAAGASFYLNGYMDDIRITTGVARYTANFIPPQASPKLK